MSKKISQLNGLQKLPADSQLTFISSGQNYRITIADFLNAIGVTGSIAQQGVDGINVLNNPTQSQNFIRNLVATKGVKASLTPSEAIQIETDLKKGTQGIQVLSNEDTEPTIRSLQAGEGITLTRSGETIQITASENPVASNTIIVNQLSDLPTPVGDVIYLSQNTNYLFASEVDIGFNELRVNAGTSITGSSVFSTGITTLKTGAVISREAGNYGFSIENLYITAPNADVFNLDSATEKTGVMIVHQMYVQSCNTLGTISNFDGASITHLIVFQCAGKGISFGGANGVLNLDSGYVKDWTGVFYDLQDAEFDIVNIENTNGTSDTLTNVFVDGLPNSGNISVGGHGAIRSNSIIGDLTASANILPSDIGWNYIDNIGLKNSQNIAEATMPVNANITNVISGTPVKVNGVFTQKIASRFEVDLTGRITYIGDTPIDGITSFTFSMEKLGGSNGVYRYYFAKNGVPVTDEVAEISLSSGFMQVSLTSIQPIDTNDYIELFVEGVGTSDDVRVFALVGVVNA